MEPSLTDIMAALDDIIDGVNFPPSQQIRKAASNNFNQA